MLFIAHAIQHICKIKKCIHQCRSQWRLFLFAYVTWGIGETIDGGS